MAATACLGLCACGGSGAAADAAVQEEGVRELIADGRLPGAWPLPP